MKMSNIIPPLVSSSPPPMVAGEPDDLDEDEFGDFTAAADLSSFEGYSLPTTPQHSSLSNFLTSISTQNTFPTQTNFIISPTSNSPLTKEPFATELPCNGQDDHINSTEYNSSADNSENIFCDINKPDVNVHKNESSFVYNKFIENQEDINTNVENVMSIVQNEQSDSKSNLHAEFKENEKIQDSENHCDKQNEDECIKASEFNKSELQIPEEDIQILENKSTIEDNLHFKEDTNTTDEFCSSNEIDNLENNSEPQKENDNEFNKTSSCMEIRENSIIKGEINNLVDANNISAEIFGESRDAEVLMENTAAVFNECAINVVEETKYYKDTEINENVINTEIENVEEDFSDFKSSYVSIANDNQVVNNFEEFSSNTKTEAESESESLPILTKPETVSIDTSIVVEDCNDDDDDDDDDFGDFSNFSDFKTAIETENNMIIDDAPKEVNEDFDDFGDFNDYSIIQEQSKNVEFTSSFDIKSNESVQNAEQIFKTIFTINETKLPECDTVNFESNDVFKRVQDIENTNALSYHWTNSESQKTLLKALNIDSRNILFGPRWNVSMPRFAANLGFTPLEPVRTDVSSSTSASTSTPPIVPPQNDQAPCEVPDAKFDWNSSGLVNPLDYSQSNTMLLDLEQLVPSLDIPHVTLSSSQQNNVDPLSLDLDSWDFWLQTQTESIKLETIEEKLNRKQLSINSNELGQDSITNTPLDLNILSDSESVNSLKFIEATPDVENDLKIEILDTTNHLTQNTKKDDDDDDDDDFSSFQSSKLENHWTPNMIPMKVPLRETHISTPASNVEHNPIYSLESFELESTVVTPDLPRKTIEIEIAESIEDDDFTDFQMGTPQVEKQVNNVVVTPAAPVSYEPLKPIVLETCATASTKINWPEPGIVSDDLNEFEFNFKSISKPETQQQQQQQQQHENIEPKVVTKQIKLHPSASEEDDWSDFVCVQDSASTTTTKTNEIKTVKMNLPKAMTPQHSYQNTNNFSKLFTNELSVPNLQNTQLSNKSVLPPSFMPNASPTRTNTQPSTQQLAAQQIAFGYQPPYQIPLQTISTPFGGLPQTSLSSYNHFSIGPTELSGQSATQHAKPSGVVGLFDGPFHPEMKPFQNSPAQVNSESQYIHPIPTPTGYQLNSVESTFLKMQQPTKETLNTFSSVRNGDDNNAADDDDDDDDDWTEFVSSQPAANININGFNCLQKPITNANIIANPVHFEAFQSYQHQPGPSLHNKNLNCKKPGNLYQTQTQQTKNKSSVPSISALPDLDFIAPKSKFFSKK